MLNLFFTFFKIGLFTFGGGYAMIPLLSEEISQFGIDEFLFSDFIAISESTPGPFAINIATFIGYSCYGIIGAMIATLGVILPSFLIMLLIAILYKKIKNTKFFKTLMKFLSPVVLGLILSSLVKISSLNLFNVNSIFTLKNDFNIKIITTITFAILTIVTILYYIIKRKKISPFKIIILAFICGASSYLFFL